MDKKYNESVINLRRALHQIPEQGFKEYQTSQLIKDELNKIGITWREYAGTGVVGIIKGFHQGKTIALRADMDGLQITEQTNAFYQSKNPGMMHACGHDGHMAMLLTAAKILKDRQSEIKGTVKLIFQPCEEGPYSGAVKMIEEGVMDDVDGVFAIHLNPDLETGKVSVESGHRLASSDYFDVYITGSAGHGSMPHQCNDSVVVGSAILMTLK